MDVLLPGFFENKSILRTWMYTVVFHDERLYSVINPYHVVDISVPFYEFEATTTSYGSIAKSFVTLTKDRGLQFSMTLEEDRLGSVTQLIHTLQQTIVNENGVYNNLLQQRLGNITVVIHDDAGNDVMSFDFVTCRFVGADGFSLAYSNSDTLKHKINFLCDVVDFKYLINSNTETASNIPKMPLGNVANPEQMGAIPAPIAQVPIASPDAKEGDANSASKILGSVLAKATPLAKAAGVPPTAIDAATTKAGNIASTVDSTKAKADKAVGDAKVIGQQKAAKVLGAVVAVAVPLAKIAGVPPAKVDAAVTQAGKIANTVGASKSVGQAAAIIGLSEGTIAAKSKATALVENLGLVKQVGNSANQAINTISSKIAQRLGLGKQ